MKAPTLAPLGPAELERILRETDPSVLLVPPRILRRVIKEDRGLGFLGRHVSRRDSYVIGGSALRAIVAADEIGLRPSDPWPSTVILLSRPEPNDLASASRADVLLNHWRILFHARVQAAIDGRFADGDLTGPGLRRRIERIGRVEFQEIRNVLREDGDLLPPIDDRAVYREFAASFLELRQFARWLLRHEFPAIRDLSAVEGVLAEDVDARALFQASRPAGAPDPRPSVLPEEGTAEDESVDDEGILVAAGPSQGYYRWLIRRAGKVGSKGNLVRAAILQTQAERHAGPALGRRARAGARGELERLARRLQSALGFDEAELDRWRRALPALLVRSARGFWMPEARLLYDLQKVCDDHEREVFTVDLVEWTRALFRRPLKRSLPHLQAVMISNHLRRAARRLPSAKLARVDRERLHHLLGAAVNRAEAGLRRRFRPMIDSALTANDFLPRNLPERVAYRKLIEELLDRIVEHGYLTLGHLRDACSRSNLKIPDLAGPLEFLRGDRLLRTDLVLAEALDGVYHRGEIYLRMLQRFSAAAFATRWGRFLTLAVALPFGGAFVALEGMKHLVEMIGGVEVPFAEPPTLLTVGLVALGLINFPAYRRQFGADLGVIGRSLRTVLYDWPARLLRLPLVRRVLDSRAFSALWRFALKPVVVIAPFWLLGRLAGIEWRGTVPSSAVIFASLSFLLNTRFGRDAEEIVADGVTRNWRRFWFDLLPGLYRLIMGVFQRFLEEVERVIYAVDEWLRFRGGQRRGSMAAKAALGTLWFFVAYLVRIYVNLLIEPQVNPIKHFPVVTVSHKIILPMSLTLTRLLAAPLMPLGPVAANFLAGTTVLLFPGVFGFLVWEFKENWKLYEANRPETLQPVVVGHHGETLARLLRPGFHSGTVPKLFVKLRRSERRALEAGGEKGVHKHRESLHRVEHELRRFLERDVVALVEGSRVGPDGFDVGRIELATNCIRARFRVSDESADEPIGIEFVEAGGALDGQVDDADGFLGFTESQRRVLTTALRGLAEMSAADGRGEPPYAWERWVEAWEPRPPAASVDGESSSPISGPSDVLDRGARLGY